MQKEVLQYFEEHDLLQLSPRIPECDQKSDEFLQLSEYYSQNNESNNDPERLRSECNNWARLLNSMACLKSGRDYLGN